MARYWTGKGNGTSWTDPANWSAGVPGAGTTASFSGAGSVLATLVAGTTLTTGELTVSQTNLLLSAGSLAFAPPSAQSGNTIDLLLTNGATLAVQSGAHLSGNNVAEIGNGTFATLQLHGSIAEEYGIVRGGELVVGGPHAHWISGDSGIYVDTGTLIVKNGGTIDAGGKLSQYPAAALQIEGNSRAMVTGANSTIHLANLFLADQTGTASLTVQQGGAVIVGGGQVGNTGDGTLTVTGAGSSFTATRGLTIGGQVPVNSALVVSNGATARFGTYARWVCEAGW